jgi:hypothetical protein
MGTRTTTNCPALQESSLATVLRAHNKTSSNRTCVAAVNVSPFRQGALRLELIPNAADERERPPRALVVDVVEAGTYEVIHF